MLELGHLSTRCPDVAVEALEPGFLKYRLFSANVERLATGFRWLEGPVWYGDGRFLLASDVANNRIVRWDEATGLSTVYREQANFANGNTRDLQGRLVTCEGAVSRRITRTHHDGSIETIADRFDGKRLNGPNDIVCRSDGSIWFTDPQFQLRNDYEGRIGQAELADAVYRIDPADGSVAVVVDGLQGPNGLCFSPDERQLYVVECQGHATRRVWRFDLLANGTLANKTLHLDAGGPGAFDGIKADVDGNIWAGWGSDGSAGASAAVLDGVKVFDPQGKPIGHIHLPERCANLCFGGERNNRLFMASTKSLYALFVNTRGAELRGRRPND